MTVNIARRSRDRWRIFQQACLAHGGRSLARGINLLFPPTCAVCDVGLDDVTSGPLLCDTCQQTLVCQQPYCFACGTTQAPGVGAADSCAWCRPQKLRFDGVVRLGRYVDPLRKSVLATKHLRGQPLALSLAELLWRERQSELRARQLDVVVPIPMHWSRRAWRGFNNPDVAARRLAVHLGLPQAAHLLRRARHTQPQADLSPPQRRENVRGAFRASKHADLPGARVLLVDDILTTGATASEAARVLKQAGAAHVTVAVIARAEEGLRAR